MSAVIDLDWTKAVQWRASDPAASAWVVANAGSGKTHVLTQRVIRLLLSGADPAAILCLTFTKVAAAEMARRIFGELGRWTTLAEAELRAAVAELQGSPPSTAELREARRLFARALETPGGLKIQTIHAFCERLLHQFPFEANVPGQFAILDDTAAAALLATARDRAMQMASDAPEGRLGQAVRWLAEHATDFDIARALDCVLAEREAIRRWTDLSASAEGAGSIDDALADLAGRLGLLPGENVETACRAICESAGWGRADCETVAAQVAAAIGRSPNAINARLLTRLRGIATSADPRTQASARLDLFLHAEEDGWTAYESSDRYRSHQFGADFGRANADLLDRFEAESARLVVLAGKLSAAKTLAATEALVVVGDAIVQAYGAAKRRAGHLDFGDLVVKTRNLLSRGEAAAWVLYKLDARIDHILVDEAQDTSPDQWAVVQALAADFFAGKGAYDAARTIFAVGDDKQSIFGFQGAAPEKLAEMERTFRLAAEGAAAGWARQALQLSFRSTTEVLDAVDHVFAATEVSAFDYEPHAAKRLDEPGRVVVLPRIVRARAGEPEDWTTPFDAPAAAEVALADQVAEEIVRLKAKCLPSGKQVGDGDFLILVRRRDAFIPAMNRALRKRGIRTAGADRIPVASHIATLDMLALADVALLPEDDLQLAALLKSPLVGLCDDALMRLALDRKSTLWAALRDSVEPVFQTAHARLAGWRAMADQVTPFRFFATVLGPDGGRRAFRERMGSEPDDVLDAFLSQALAYEGVEAPSLQGFAAYLRASRSDIKREAEAASTGARIMTVHGAKGLEAEVVFLVDTGGQIAPHQHRDILVELAEERRGPAFLWRRVKAEATPQQRAADALADAAMRREYLRLLYVAMTRARDVLVVCGIRPEKKDKDDPERWYSRVFDALVPADAERDPETGELATRLEWPQPARPAATPAAAGAVEPDATREPPGWLRRPVPAPAPAPRPLRPSRALGEPDPPLPGEPARDPLRPEPADRALRRGRAVHRLLQVLPGLPAGERHAAATRLLARELADDAELASAVRAEAAGVLDHPALAGMFGKDSRAETAIVGQVATPGGVHAVSGRIDRLVRTDAGWHILDFKTGRAPGSPEEAPGEVLQMALYRRLLMDMQPGEIVEATLVWTAGPNIMPIPADLAEQALAKLGIGAPGIS